MTRKHFQAIADILLEARNQGKDLAALDHLISEFAHYLSTQNPNFDRDRFERACLGLK